MPKETDEDTLPDNVKVIKDEDYIQEGEVTLTVDNLAEVTAAIAVLSKLRQEAIDTMGVDEEPEDEDDIAVTSVEFRIEDGKVIAHVTQGLVG
jgi:hypothetical protein